jgi:hypothetical protein
MQAVEEQLQRGAILIERATGDADLLGVALLALHGALETYLREQLRLRQDLTPEERHQVDVAQVSGAALLTLARRYLKLGPDQLEVIVGAGDWRRSLARGEPFDGTEDEVRGYARFVAALCGLGGTLDEAMLEWRERLRDERYQPRRVVSEPRSLPWGSMLAGVLLIGALLFTGWATTRLLPTDNLLAAFGLAPQPTVTPAPPQATLFPAPRRQTAVIARLSGGPGWLHEVPEFGSATLPIRLSEGMVVTLLDQQRNDADGNLWQLVTINGYIGWSPLNNLEMVP